MHAAQSSWRNQNHLARNLLLICGLVAGFFSLAWLPVLAVSVPSVGLPATSSVLVGEDFTFTVSFSNTGGDPGYGPFIDLIFPNNGADGANGADTLDGISFVSASYLSSSLSSQTLTFPDDGGGTGCVDHPFAKDGSGNPLSVCGPAEDTLVVLTLPYGSYTPAQPDLDVTITATVSNLADVSTGLDIEARSGFRFGNDPLDNPTSDPSLVSSYATLTATPTLISLSKSYNGPENETATGPNFPRRYTINVDIADGQEITDLDVTDLLPNNLAYLSLISSSPGGASIIDSPTVGSAANSPDNDLVVRFPSVTGGTGSNDAQVVLEYFVPELDADTNPVIDPSTGDDATSVNDAAAAGLWDPVDTRDASGSATTDVTTNDHTLTPKSIAIQKGVGIATDVGEAGYTPGDTLEYTLNFQISDFFSFENIEVEDVISDGQRFDATFSPTISFSDYDESLSGSFTVGSNLTVDISQIGNDTNPITDGSTTLTFDVSQVVQDLGGADGALRGGYADTPTGGSTTGTIVFRTVIQDEFSDTYPTGDESVDINDVLSNSVTITGDVVNNTTLVPTGSSESDGSSASVQIIEDNISKTIYAINGNTSFSQSRIAPGDEVTYRLRDSIPTADFEALVFDDYLPLPVFDATDVTVFNDVIDATVPASGEAKFGPAETLRGITGIVPSISTTAASNLVTFTIGTFDDPSSPPAEVDILFTVTVNDEPFADDLLLTNQFSRTLNNTEGSDIQAETGQQITLAQPLVDIYKGVVSTDNTNGSFSPTLVGPVAFTSPGGGCPRFGSTIHSQDLATTPINSDLSDVDAADLVTFALVLENTGHSPSGAFDVQVRDVLPTGYATPSGGINLCVTDGTGAPISYTDLGGGLFGSGIELDDPGPTVTPAGALDEYDEGDLTTGRNIAIITYDLEIDALTEPDSELTNTGTLQRYAGQEGGESHLPPNKTDDATVTTGDVVVNKTITGTNQAHTSGNNVVIGEVVTYQTVITIPEGTLTNTTLVDQLDSGLSIVSLGSLTPSAGLSTTYAGSFAGALAAAVIGTGGDDVTIDLATLTNSNTDNSTAETLTLSYTVVVINDVANTNGLGLNNRAELSWTEGSDFDRAPNVTVREPQLQVVKSVSPNPADGGDTVTFTMVVSHTGSSTEDAFEVTLEDIVPSGITYVASSLANVSGETATLDDASAPTLTASWSQLDVGQTSTIEFEAIVSTSAFSGDEVINDATIKWSSLPGDVTTPISTYNNTSCERTGDTVDCGNVANDYVATGSASLQVGEPQIDKQTPVPGSYTIGETITFDLLVTLPEGTTDDLVVLDDFPAGVSYDTGTAQFIETAAGSGGLLTQDYNGTLAAPTISGGGDGGVVSFDFGDTPTVADGNADNNSFLIRLDGTVLNVLSNQNGVTKTNTGTVEFFDPSIPGTNSNSDNETFDIDEPILNLTKSVSPSSGDAGDTVSFQIDIAHEATSSATAYDLVLSDVVPSEFTNITNVVVSASNITPPSFDLTGQTLTIPDTGSFDLPQNATVTITFDADVVASVEPSEVVRNTAVLTWSTLDGSVAGERTDGDGLLNDGSLNDYELRADDDFTVGTFSISKGLTTTSASHTSGTELTIGEIATYQLTVTLPEATFSSLQIVDFLPAGLSYVANSFSLNLAGLNATVVPGDFTFSTNSGDETVDGASGEDITLDVTSFSVAGDNNTGNNSFTVSFQALVLDVVGNQGQTNPGTALQNLAGIRIAAPDSFTNSNQVDSEVVEPLLTISKNASATTVRAGQLVTFTVVIENTGQSAAQDVLWEDTLPAEMYEAGSNLASLTSVVSSTAGTLSEGDDFVSDFSGNPVTIDFTGTNNTDIDPGETITITYTATVEGTVVDGQIFSNDTEVTSYSSLDGTSGDERSYGPVSDSETLTAQSPGLVTNKTLTSGDTEVQTGQTLDFEFTVENVGSALAQDVDVVDTLPAGVEFVPGSMSASWSSGGSSTADPTGSPGPTLTWDLNATIDPGDTLTLAYQATVTSASPGSYVNTAQATADDGAGSVIPTDSAFAGDTDDDDQDTAEFDVTDPEVSIDKSLATGQQILVPPGEQVTYTITLTNTGSTTIEVLPVNDTYDTTLLSFVSSTIAPDDTNDDGQIDWSDVTTLLSDLNPSDSITFDVTFEVLREAALIENTAATTTGTDEYGDPVPPVTDSDDTASSLPEITFTKTSDPEPGSVVLPGDIITYKLTVENPTSITLSNLNVSDVINTGKEYKEDTIRLDGADLTDDADGDEGEYHQDSQTVKVTIPSLAGGASVEIWFDVRVLDTEDKIENAARITSTQGIDQGTETIEHFVDPIAITKTVEDLNGGNLEPGDELLWKIDVKNIGISETVFITITDTIPDELTYVPGSITGDGANDKDAPELEWEIGVLEIDEEVHLSYRTTLNEGVPDGTEIENAAYLNGKRKKAKKVTRKVVVGESISEGVVVEELLTTGDELRWVVLSLGLAAPTLLGLYLYVALKED